MRRKGENETLFVFLRFNAHFFRLFLLLIPINISDIIIIFCDSYRNDRKTFSPVVDDDDDFSFAFFSSSFRLL